MQAGMGKNLCEESTSTLVDKCYIKIQVHENTFREA